jgi:hypothetical protein
MLRFMLHILPFRMARVRHAGLFTASGRESRLVKCRLLILAAKQPNIVTDSGGETREAASFINEQTQNIVTGQDIETTREMSVQVATECQTASDQAIIDEQTTEENANAGEVDDEPPKVRTCECRYCKGEAVGIGRLKGEVTNRIILTAQSIVGELDTHLPEINISTVSDLLAAIRLSWLTLCFLPAAIAALLGGQTLTRLEASALEARLLHELRLTPGGSALGLIFEPSRDESAPTSGIPPPPESKVVAST